MILPPMTDGEFAEMLRRTPRVTGQQEVQTRGDVHDRETGPWTGNEIVRHEYGESRG